MQDKATERATLQQQFDAAVASQAGEIAQDAANVEASLAETAEEYVDLVVKEAVLRQAVEIFRDRNQGPVIALAKSLFSALTRNRYSGLRADVDAKGEPVLIAERKDKSLEVQELSDGTRDALYLALRLAAIRHHNAHAEPIPFVADDLLLNFDDERAKAAFGVLSELASTGQVLFFTHHTHMIDLARAAVPSSLLCEHGFSPMLAADA